MSARGLSRNPAICHGWKSLRLYFTATGSDGAAALAASPYLKSLADLDLSGNGLPDSKGVSVLRKRLGSRLTL
jgi:hypothetical protein